MNLTQRGGGGGFLDVLKDIHRRAAEFLFDDRHHIRQGPRLDSGNQFRQRVIFSPGH